MIKKISIGIDPGENSGAMCVIIDYESGVVEVEVHRFKNMTDKEIIDAFKPFKDVPDEYKTLVVLEKVHCNGKNGSKANWSLGGNRGVLRAAMMAYRVPFEEVSPQAWMKSYGMKSKPSETNTQWKNRLRARAQELFPSWKITLDMADAMLVARYCRTEKNL